MTGAATADTVVFLHGLGAGPQSWDAQIAALPAGFVGWAPPVPGLGGDDTSRFSLEASTAALIEELDRRGLAQVHLCGLSLGAVVATHCASHHPGRVASLTVSGGQVRPNRTLMLIQNALIRLLPARLVAPPGMAKQSMLAVVEAVADMDLRADVAAIQSPTLVLCGSRDKPNLPAARALAAGIAGAELQIVPGAGHEWNTRLPREFSGRLNAFLSANRTEPRLP